VPLKGRIRTVYAAEAPLGIAEIAAAVVDIDLAAVYLPVVVHQRVAVDLLLMAVDSSWVVDLHHRKEEDDFEVAGLLLWVDSCCCCCSGETTDLHHLLAAVAHPVEVE
jgi:hypothetical protein